MKIDKNKLVKDYSIGERIEKGGRIAYKLKKAIETSTNDKFIAKTQEVLENKVLPLLSSLKGQVALQKSNVFIELEIEPIEYTKRAPKQLQQITQKVGLMEMYPQQGNKEVIDKLKANYDIIYNSLQLHKGEAIGVLVEAIEKGEPQF